MNLAKVLTVGDRDQDIETVGLVTALVTGVEVRVDEPPANSADARSNRGDVPHRSLVSLAGLINPYRHKSRG